MSDGGMLITKIKQLQSRILEAKVRNYGIVDFNGAQGRILHVLWQMDNIPIVTIAEQTGLAKTTLTTMLDRLEKTGLLKRYYDTSDRRQIRICLTEKAKAISDAYYSISHEMTNIFYRGFSEKEIQDFECYLKRIMENLREEECNGTKNER